MSRRKIDEIEDPIWRQLALSFSKNVTLLRQKKGWTQADLAKECSLNVSTIADVEQGATSNPRLETIAALMRGLSPSDPLILLKKPMRCDK